MPVQYSILYCTVHALVHYGLSHSHIRSAVFLSSRLQKPQSLSPRGAEGAPRRPAPHFRSLLSRPELATRLDSSLRGDRLGDRYSLFIWRSPVARAAVRSSAPLESSRYSAAPLIYLSRVQRLPSTRRVNANKRTLTQRSHNRCSLSLSLRASHFVFSRFSLSLFA